MYFWISLVCFKTIGIEIFKSYKHKSSKGCFLILIMRQWDIFLFFCSISFMFGTSKVGSIGLKIFFYIGQDYGLADCHWTIEEVAWLPFQKNNISIIQLKNKSANTSLLCILTSERLLRTPLAGWNQFFDANIVHFVPLVMEKVVLASEVGCSACHLLVKIHNTFLIDSIWWNQFI